MNEAKARPYLDKFPDVPEELFRDARRIHSAFILFDHKGGAYCTNCEKEFSINIGEFSHKVKCYCPECGIGAVAVDIAKSYKGTKTADIANASIFLAGDDGNLYVRCFSQKMAFMHGELKPRREVFETQRYVFTPNGAARFGRITLWSCDRGGYVKYYDPDVWRVNTKFSEPNFLDTGFGYRVYHNYGDINLDNALKDTWMKNCMVGEADRCGTLTYLNFFIRHQGAERLIKCGFASDVERMLYSDKDLEKYIDWKQTEAAKMLGINRAELRYIRENKIPLRTLRDARIAFPELSVEKAVEYFRTFHVSLRTLTRALEFVGKENIHRLVKYMSHQEYSLAVYNDYIENCDTLGYDLTSREILFPPHLADAHDRASAAVEARRLEEDLKRAELDRACINKLKKERRRLEFEYGDYLIRQPEDAEEIIEEGKILRHCVGGYAERHLRGATTIMFLRRKSDPDKPFFTIEVDNDLEIVQCHGYRNEFEGEKPEDIIKLEEIYQNYLEELKRGITKTQIKIGA